MIPLQFGLFFAGAKLSYLRYLTFYSLRHFHPNAQIFLYTVKKFRKDDHKWGAEKQDFEKNEDGKHDYMLDLLKLGVHIVEIDYFGGVFNPVYQSDLFRWWWLKHNGGIYLDTDQIILKPFGGLPLDKEFIYSEYPHPQLGTYAPVGVLGLEKGSAIADKIMGNMSKHYSPQNYNSSGPFMMQKELRNIDLSRSWNAPSEIFYPMPFSDGVSYIYNGQFVIPDASFAFHWFGGHPLSQEFNNKCNEEYVKNSNDTISKFARELFKNKWMMD